MKGKKILVLRFSSIGDIVLTSPVVRCLKTQLKNVEIHFCTKAEYATLVENNRYIDKCYYLNNSLTALIKKLQKEKYDYVIDLHNNLRTLTIKSALVNTARNLSFNKLNYKKWLYVNFKLDTMPDDHIVDRYMDTVKSLGIENDENGLDYFIPYKDEVELDWLPSAHQNGFVAFAIGGGHATKRLPFSKIIEVCQKINRPIILLGGKEEEEIGEEVVNYFEHVQDETQEEDYGDVLVKNSVKTRVRVYSACGKYNINQSASILRQAHLVFSHDTGLMHIASAFKKTIYSIWGNTTPALGMYPYKTSYVVLENKEIGCRPCSKLGHKKCPLGHFKCMYDIPLNFKINNRL